MHIRTQGFMLLEWLVAFMVMVLSMFFLTHVFTPFYMHIVDTHKRALHVADRAAACDVLIRDLQHAITVKINHSGGQCSISLPHKRITWYCTKNRLMRTVSVYDKRVHKWGRGSAAVVARDIKSFVCESSGGLVTITVEGCNKNCSPITLSACIRNRKIIMVNEDKDAAT